MKLGFPIALRFLKSNPAQTFLIVLGIAIGVSVQIFIGSLIQGLQKSLVEKTVGNSSQITVTSDGENDLKEYDSLMDTIANSDERIEYISAVNDQPAFLETGDTSQSLLIRGVVFDDADKIYNLSENLTEGALPETDDEILLGVDLKEEYELEIGDTVDIVSVAQNSRSYTISGFFDLQVSTLNTGWGFTTLNSVQTLFETEDTVTSIEMKVYDSDIFDTDLVSENISTALGKKEVEIVNWKETNESLLSGLQGQSISSYMIQVFVLISVVLGIASVLAITVLQKSRQIGILKAMGIRNKAASSIFLSEGLILGVLGGVLGILFGLGLAVSFTTFAVNADGTPVVALYINPSFIMISGLIAVIASVGAALFPAIRSSKLNPIDIIRNN